MKKLIIFIPFLLFASMQLPFVRWVPDDAYISFQYAGHFARGEGLVFNLGERVEGFSNLLWTLYLGTAGRLGLDIVKTAVVSSSLAAFTVLLLILLLFARIERTASGSEPERMRRITLAMSCLAACFFPLAFYATSGMESAAYVAALLLGIILQIDGMTRKQTLPLALASLPFLIAALLRPEGILFLGGSVLYSIVAVRPLPRRLPAALLPALLVFCGVMLLKARYFGGLLPNTYYAKPGVSLNYLTPALDGTFYLFRFALKSALVLLLPFALFPPRSRERLRIWVYLWLIVSMQVFFIVYVGVDVLRFDRFVLPIYPCYLALAVLGISELIAASGAAARRFIFRFVYVCAGIIAASNIGQAALARNKRCIHDWMHGGSLTTLGLVIRNTFPEARLVVANEVGAVAYYSGKAVIDMLGLTDRTISGIRYQSYLQNGTGSDPEGISRVSEYILSRNPDIVILPSFSSPGQADQEAAPESMHPLWYGLYADPRFMRDFLNIVTIAVNDDKYLSIFARRGTPIAPPDPSLWRDSGCGRIQWHGAVPGTPLPAGGG